MKVKVKPTKEVILEAISFSELVTYGINNGANIVEGMPWSFNYKGQPISHENDKCYLIPNKSGTDNMTPDDMLITGCTGMLFVMSIENFNDTYEKVED